MLVMAASEGVSFGCLALNAQFQVVGCGGCCLL